MVWGWEKLTEWHFQSMTSAHGNFLRWNTTREVFKTYNQEYIKKQCMWLCVCTCITCEEHDPRKYIANVEILLKSHHIQFVLKITSQCSKFSYLDKIPKSKIYQINLGYHCNSNEILAFVPNTNQ